MNSEMLNADRGNETESKKHKGKKNRIFDIIAYLLCLLISIGIWVYVVSLENENYEYTFENIEVQLEGVSELQNDRNLSILSGYDTKINVTVVGSRQEILKYTAEDIYAYINLDNVKTANKHALEVSVNLPTNSIKLVSSSVTKINVVVDETVTMTFDLDIEEKNLSISDDLKRHKAEPSVDKVVVTGPKTVVDEIASAKVTCDIGTVTTSITINSTIKLIDKDRNEIVNPYVKTDVTDVVVKYPVTMEKILPLVPDYLADDADKFNYSITFDPLIVKLEGDPQVISALKEIKVDLGNVTRYKDGTVTVDKLELPVGVKLYNTEIKDIAYSITKTAIDTSAK